MIGAAAGAFKTGVETLAALTHPTNATGGNACHKGIVGDITGYYRSGCYEGGTTNGVTAYNGAISPKRRSLLDQCLGINSMHGEMGTGRGDIGEDARRTTKDIVLYLNTFIHRHIVLYAHAIADAHIIADVDILTQAATAAKDGSALDMAEMPYLGALAYRDPIIDITRRMDIILLL